MLWIIHKGNVFTNFLISFFYSMLWYAIFKWCRGINVTDGLFEGTGPLACLSPFSVKLWIRSDYVFRSDQLFIFEKHFPINNSATTRATTFGKLIEKGFSNLTKDTSINDATRLWNIAPNQIKQSTSVYSAKKSIKDFVKTLPM